MGDCIYCGKPAGIFKSRHPACVEAEAKARAEACAKAAEETRRLSAQRLECESLVRELMQEAYFTVRDGGDLVSMEAKLRDAIAADKLTPPQMKEMLISAWEMSVDDFLDDGVLESEEEDKLVRCQNRFSLSQGELDRNGKFGRVAKSAILRKVLEGKLPDGVEVDTHGAVNFQRGEVPVWLFNGAEHFADTVRKQFVGRSQGMSFRVMSGVYYRVGGFKGEPVSTVERKLQDTGVLVVTNQALYFLGQMKTTRHPYKKIVSFNSFSDGIGLMRDTATARPQLYKVDDPWFAYNLVTNLAKIHGRA